MRDQKILITHTPDSLEWFYRLISSHGVCREQAHEVGGDMNNIRTMVSRL